MESTMNRYEAIFLFKTKDAKEDWDALVDHVGELVSSSSGTVTSAVKWDEKKLAYNIRGQSRAAYMLVYFDGEPTSVAALHQKCKLSNRVMRLLVVKDGGSGDEEMAKDEVPAEVTIDEVPTEKAKDETRKEEEPTDGVREQSIPDRESHEGPGA